MLGRMGSKTQRTEQIIVEYPKNDKEMEEGILLPLLVKDINNKVPENVVELKKVKIVDNPIGTNNIINKAKLLKEIYLKVNLMLMKKMKM